MPFHVIAPNPSLSQAWEIVDKWLPSYAAHPEVDLHRKAAWIVNGNITMANPEMAYAVPDPKYARSHGLVKGVTWQVCLSLW